MIANNEFKNDLSVTQRSSALKGLQIGLCVTGGIASLEAPKVARELRRMGAKIKVFATENALRFVGKDALEWACDSEVRLSATGQAEHIALEDAVLVFPATVDIIGKAANGICPDACSTYLQSALGSSCPIFMLPTMHDSLRQSPAFKMNMRRLEDLPNVFFLEPRVEEGKWKAPDPKIIASDVAYRLNKIALTKKIGFSPNVLLTLGGTATHIDAARTITNLSTGLLGSMIIARLLERGVTVTAICANHHATIPHCSGLKAIEAVQFSEMEQQLTQQCLANSFHGLFHLAAISDYGPSNVTSEKITSKEKELTLNLKQLPKLISTTGISNIEFKIACKYTASNKPQESEKAYAFCEKHNLDALLWNWGESAFGESSTNQSMLIQKNYKAVSLLGKEEASKAMTDLFLSHLVKNFQAQ
jgi:phosphopantothenoylcysteine decarboxylase/phosphopantothenate--cysteine ligase